MARSGNTLQGVSASVYSKSYECLQSAILIVILPASPVSWSFSGGLPYGANLLLQMIKRVGGWRRENPVGLALAVPYNDAAK